MFNPFKLFLKSFANYCKYLSMPQSHRDLVFYSEGAHDWPHLGGLVKKIIHKKKLVYLTSDLDDPGLFFRHHNLFAFYIGSGSIRTLLLNQIDCKVFVTSIPEIDSYHLKRSKHIVHYIYTFHSMNSTHYAYRDNAFDAFDTILCSGPHHKNELELRHNKIKLRQQNLIEFGFIRLDDLITHLSTKSDIKSDKPPQDLSILIAPTWGPSSLVESEFGSQIISHLVKSFKQIVLRVHPMTLRTNPNSVESIREQFLSFDNFIIERSVESNDTLIAADILITDWSGIGTEFAFGLEKPVLFIDTPQKTNNANYSLIDLPPLEKSIRSEIGCVVDLGSLETISDRVIELYKQKHQMKKQICEAREKWIYNVGKSAEIGSQYILNLVGNR